MIEEVKAASLPKSNPELSHLSHSFVQGKSQGHPWFRERGREKFQLFIGGMHHQQNGIEGSYIWRPSTPVCLLAAIFPIGKIFSTSYPKIHCIRISSWNLRCHYLSHNCVQWDSWGWCFSGRAPWSQVLICKGFKGKAQYICTTETQHILPHQRQENGNAHSHFKGMEVGRWMIH